MSIHDYDKMYTDFHLRLLNNFIAQVANEYPFCADDCTQEDRDFLVTLQELPTRGGAELLIQGQVLFCRIVAAYPHLMAILPRDLLWFFGGDCLHYMPDEEIASFQRLDELREDAKVSGEPFSYEKARAAAYGMH